MARFLKQSTAFTFRAGPFVDSTDGVTAETALSIAQADIQLSKAGGAFAQTSASPTTTHDADGWYQCPLTTTDTGTVGTLTVQIVMAGALPVWHDFMVLPAAVYDALVGGTVGFPINSGLKKNAALAKFQFLMTDSTNHNPATGLTVSGYVSKDGGTFSAITDTVTEVASGTYEVDLSATEMNANNVTLRFTATAADDLVVTLRTDP
jgi:hypothetical protein